MWKRDIQGKFALKNDDYRQVRSLRLTDDTWKALGIAAECLGMTRADYLEYLIANNAFPSITRKDSVNSPCNTPSEEFPVDDHAVVTKSTITHFQMTTLETLRDRVLFELKLGKQAPGYKAALKALNLFIAELSS